MTDRLTRAGLIRAALATGAALALAPREALAATRRTPHLRRLAIRNAGRAYAGDRPLLATVSPGVRGRDRAAVSFALDRRAKVRLEAVRTALRKKTVVWADEAVLGPERIGTTVAMRVMRGGQIQELRLTIGERP